MNFRKWTSAILVVFLAACSNPPAPPPVPEQQLTQIKEYLAANPVEIPSGWSRGILIVSRQIDFECLGGICHTWEGAVVKNDGNVVGLASVQGNSEIYSVMNVGDDFLWTGTPNYKSDIRVVKPTAVAINTALPSPTS